MSGASLNPRTVEEIFKDFSARRVGIVRALTLDVDDFYGLCDPEKENLCLYGHPNESWEVNLPAEEVPPELPEPALGINFARDGMNRRDWLSLVAVHSDCWLLSVAFYFGAHLNRNERKRLFSMINDLPTVFEVVSERKPMKDKPSVDSGSKSRGSTKMVNLKNTIRTGAGPSNDPRPNARNVANPGEEREFVSHNNPMDNDQAQVNTPMVFDAATIEAIRGFVIQAFIDIIRSITPKAEAVPSPTTVPGFEEPAVLVPHEDTVRNRGNYGQALKAISSTRPGSYNGKGESIKKHNSQRQVQNQSQASEFKRSALPSYFIKSGQAKMNMTRDGSTQRSSQGKSLIHCYNCGTYGHKSNVCPKEKKTCFVCGKEGHLQKFCRQGKQKGAESRQWSVNQNKRAEHGGNPPMASGGQGQHPYDMREAYGPDAPNA